MTTVIEKSGMCTHGSRTISTNTKSSRYNKHPFSAHFVKVFSQRFLETKMQNY